jgi:hypothetical protein
MKISISTLHFAFSRSERVPEFDIEPWEAPSRWWKSVNPEERIRKEERRERRAER